MSYNNQVVVKKIQLQLNKAYIFIFFGHPNAVLVILDSAPLGQLRHMFSIRSFCDTISVNIFIRFSKTSYELNLYSNNLVYGKKTFTWVLYLINWVNRAIALEHRRIKGADYLLNKVTLTTATIVRKDYFY